MERLKKICHFIFFSNTVPMILVGIYLFLVSIFCTLVTAYLPTQNGDAIEHIHSAFMIVIGQVPYRDFFQHHHPLLWYLFAPLTSIFRYDTTITEVVSLISFLVFLKSLTYVYRICSEFLTDKFWALAAVALIAIPGAKLYAIDLRPDNYMIFCLMGGIYYYFSYLKEEKRKSLVIAFIFFFFSFMFAQKALFPLFILGLTGLYFWFKGDIKSNDLGVSLLFPLSGCFAFFCYLYYYDMIELYFVSNYTFNIELANSFEFNKIATVPFYMMLVFVFAWGGVMSYVIYKNRYLGILSLLFISEFLQRRFYFSPYSYYYWMLFYFGAICAVCFLYKIGCRFVFISWFVVAMLFWALSTSAQLYFNFYRGAKEEINHQYLPDFITRHISPCDYVFNGDGLMYNIFAKDPSYYWQLIGQLDVIGERVGIQPKPDMNRLIEKYKPKFLYGRNYFNKFSDESGVKEIVHYIDKDILKLYYEPSLFYPIYQLKSEYQKECAYDSVSQKWMYKD